MEDAAPKKVVWARNMLFSSDGRFLLWPSMDSLILVRWMDGWIVGSSSLFWLSAAAAWAALFHLVVSILLSIPPVLQQQLKMDGRGPPFVCVSAMRIKFDEEEEVEARFWVVVLAGQEKDNIPTRLFLSRSEMCCQRPIRNEAQIDTTVAATGAQQQLAIN